MKRELAAAALILLLAICAALNLRRIDSLSAEIFLCIDRSKEATEQSDTEQAKKALEEGLTLWLEADRYTHIFLRHSEVDSVTDAFYEALEGLSDADSGALAASYNKLKYHIESLRSMEHISLGSIM